MPKQTRKTDALKDAMFRRDSLSCSLTKISKSGNLLRSKVLSRLPALEQRITQYFSGRMLYDIVYDGDLSFDTLTMTEVCSHGLMIHPCNFKIRQNNMHLAAKDTEHSHEDILLKIKQSSPNLDKYRLMPTPFTKHHDQIAFLCGSNIFDAVIDLKKLDNAVAAGAVIKPHPLTNQDLFHRLIRRYGQAKVLNPKASGYTHLQHCDGIFTTGSSELSIYATMLNIPVQSIQQEQPQRVGVYEEFFTLALTHDNPYHAINNIFNSHKSGVFFHWDKDDRIEQHMAYLENEVRKLREASHESA